MIGLPCAPHERLQVQHLTSRRGVLGELCGSTLTALFGMPNVSVVSVQASTLTSEQVPPVLQKWAAAWSENDDGAQLAVPYADDATHQGVPSGTVFTGPDEIGGYALSHFAAFPAVTLKLRSAFAATDRAAAEWVYAGTYTGNLPGLPLVSGQPFSVQGTAILEFEADKIQHSANYFDFCSLLEQLGVLASLKADATSTS